MADNLVAQLGKELNMEDIILSSRGNQYVLPFEGDVDVELIVYPRNYFFKSILGECPKENLDNFILQIIEGNLFGIATRGASLGYNEAENFLTLSMELDSSCGYKHLKEKLEDFVSSAIFWKEKLIP